MDAIEAARSLFERGDVGALDPWLHDTVELRPPTYGKSWHGKALVGSLLGFAGEAMRDFRYTDITEDSALHILRFEAMIGAERISGVDVVRCNADGLIVQFEVFARPPKAVLALRDAMGERVAASPEIAARMAKG